MKSEVRLDSALFQLTPTRTRCDLVIHANGKSEKLASGLLNPFLAHLKVAQDQIAKGGYSITLEPDPLIDASWFTKGTVERFVRFVSTPEILERVTTIESEILQIEEAIAVQSSHTVGLGNGEDHQQRSAEFTEGTNADGDKAIVVYKPGSQAQTEASNGNTNQEENSKVQLLKVLETRRNVLRKEQGMAFARAVAAGFDMDTLPYLVSFSECFGASRLMKASSQFMELWKRKHETGQWVEVEAIDTMSMRSELPPFNMPAILLTGDHAKSNLDGTDQSNPDGSAKTDQKNPHEYFQGQFYPPWPMPYPPPYSMQGMQYYQNYPPGGAHSYFPSPYPPTEEHHHHSRVKRHSKSSSKDSDSKSRDDTDPASESDQEALGSSQGHKSKKGSKKKKKSNMVVIKNLNYITKKLAGSDSESGSGSDSQSDKSDRSGSDKDSTDSNAKESRKKHRKSSKKKEKHGRKTQDFPRDASNRDGTGYGESQMEGDSGHWQAFQSFLLKSEEKSHMNDNDMFSSEREPVLSRRKEKGGNAADPFLPSERDYDEFGHERSSAGFDSVNGSASRVRQISSNDEMLLSGENGLTDNRFKEINGGRSRIYRRPGTGDDYFIVHGQERQIVGMGHDIDPLAESQYKQSNLDNNKSYGVNDESFMLAMRSGQHDSLGLDSRGTIDIDSELPKETRDSGTKIASQVYYEPEELTMIPDRGFEPVSAGYDPAIDYESQVHIEKVVKVEEVEESSPTVQAEGKSAEKDKKVRKSQDGVLDKRRKDALIKRLSGGSTSRANPLTEAQKRAQNLRSYKADLQKLKKEQEEEQMKRLEALKLERQKRIAARTNNANPTQQVKPKPASKPTQKTSKFTDADPNSTPVRKVVTKTTPTKSTGSGNGLARSVSSLSDTRKEKNGSGDPKRLSEPIRTPTVIKNRSVTGAAKNSSGAKETQSKRISAIMQLDQNKSATLPELKLKNNKENPFHALEFSQEKVESEMVIEKNVVTVENEVVAAPIPAPPVRESYMVVPVHSEVEKNEVYEREERMEKEATEDQYVAVRAPPSPVLDSEVIRGDMEARRGSSEVVRREELSADAPHTEIHTPVERPYQAPVARVTSMEEVHRVPTTLELGTPAQIKSIQMPVPVGSLDPVFMNQETVVEKTKGKESKGGFRKLLKFGRKSLGGEGGHTESDASSVDDVANSSHDAPLLKNLITQDDTKVSKSFSLLSPFRKADKKVIVL